MDAGRDAIETPLAVHGATRHPVQNPAIWIRLAGAWRPALIDHWRPAPGGWLAWIHHPTIPGRSGPWGLYAYDPATIRQRLSHLPPDQWRRTCSAETAAAYQWGRGGTRKWGEPLPPAPCCSAAVSQAYVVEGALVCLPCGHSTTIT
ncbi:hypothetical protein [Actinomadura kijaniata]|uniref:hypothetical protein n=1 Tax=Actinomadura kijaniata TaxID=46161 RepID=UPI0012FA24B2|nr:hypothetical protein [Actinomadura kijaniata]